MMKKIFGLFLLALVLVSCDVCELPEKELSYLPLNDSEYPYRNIPRLLIETDDFYEIRDVVTEHPATMQIYGEKSPITEPLRLTVRGRGNSSFMGMPKTSIKMEFEKKQSLLGMPEHKDWALIANFADKTLLKNFIVYKMAEWIGMEYAPRTQFVDLYFNREYQGVYLLSETVKVHKNRVNIPNDDRNFLLEKSNDAKDDETYFVTDSLKTLLIVKSKNKNNPAAVDSLKSFINEFENALLKKDRAYINSALDMDAFLKFYWLQEFTKNPDGNFHRSIFFTVLDNKTIQFGPVWDFDVAFGNRESYTPYDWYVRYCKWNYYILNDAATWKKATDFWKTNRSIFVHLPDSISKYAKELEEATKNDFKRWPVLENDELWMFKEPYGSYGEAVDSLNSWIRQRIEWLDNHT